MDKIYVVFWTQGGNTQAMAEAIGEGIREAGKEAEVVFVTGANLDELKAAPKFALGCPAMGAEVLEESEMEPFVCDVEGFASGKKIALFGSYGWGDGQWMRDWAQRAQDDGKNDCRRDFQSDGNPRPPNPGGPAKQPGQRQQHGGGQIPLA